MATKVDKDLPSGFAAIREETVQKLCVERPCLWKPRWDPCLDMQATSFMRAKIEQKNLKFSCTGQQENLLSETVFKGLYVR